MVTLFLALDRLSAVRTFEIVGIDFFLAVFTAHLQPPTPEFIILYATIPSAYADEIV